MIIKPATGLIKLYMKLCGFHGSASLWDTIYILPEHMGDAGLIRQEKMHLTQMARDGKFVFMVKYLYWLLVYGYNSPKHLYEEEARAAE